MRKLFVSLALALCSATPAFAYVNVSISINVPSYPVLQRIPGYPVYYAPRLQANYFFYDGLYWVYQPEGWYASPWYDGPWDRVAIDSVPLFVLRIPLRYYGYVPVTFQHWARNAPPRWDVIWGPDWGRRHHNWHRWNRTAVPAPAPLPHYQQRYSRTNYPDDAQRRELTERNYRYAPRDTRARQQWQTHVGTVEQRPIARQSPPHGAQVQAQPPRPREVRGNDARRAERESTPTIGHAPPRQAPMARPEPVRMQAEAPRAGPEPQARHDKSDKAEKSDKGEKDEKGNKGNKGNKGDKDDAHGPGKQA